MLVDLLLLISQGTQGAGLVDIDFELRLIVRRVRVKV